ncbi:hypothetical protein D3C77_453270 [compost metagenome]
MRIVQRLGLVHHRFAVDTLAVLGVVLDLDGQVAAEGFDEHRVENVHMRMAPHDNPLAGSLLPFEIKRRRQRDITLTAVVDVTEVVAVTGDRPAEHTDVADPLTDLETSQQPAVTDGQLQQARVLVIGIQFIEVGDETGLGEEAALQRHRLSFIAFFSCHQTVEGEHVGDIGFAF